MLAPLALLFAGSATALTVATPASLVQCQPILLQWSEGPPPFYVSIIPGGQPSGNALKDFGKLDGNSITWKVDLPVQDVTIKVVDSTGAIQFSSQVTIKEGSDKECLEEDSNTDGPAVSMTGAGPGPAPAPTPKAEATTTTSPTTAPPSPTSNSPKPSTNSTGNSTSASAKPSENPKSGARALLTGAGVAAALGAVAAAALF